LREPFAVAAAQPPDRALLDRPGLRLFGQQVRRHQTQGRLVADDQHRLGRVGPACGLQQAFAGAVGPEHLQGLEVLAQRLRRLLRAQCRADEDLGRMRDALIEPLGHALGLALALGRERAVEVALPFALEVRFGVAPQDQVHHSGSPAPWSAPRKRSTSACCALGPSVPTRW
jgi:hypothetical protein